VFCRSLREQGKKGIKLKNKTILEVLYISHEGPTGMKAIRVY
jgi:hypothetical protein